MKDVAAQIPDVWYDIYARLLPGLLFFVVSHEALYPTFMQPLWDHVTFTILISYSIGHIIQPVTGVVSRKLEANLFGGQKAMKICKDYFPADSRESRLISKQHAECASFTAMFILSVIFIALCQYKNMALDNEFFYITLAVTFYFLCCALLRAQALASRAKGYAKNASAG